MQAMKDVERIDERAEGRVRLGKKLIRIGLIGMVFFTCLRIALVYLGIL